ncbi:sialoadhesin-like [Silurus meridionalis]|nr:sialoadhesin-like [Silurus meridionalis]
MFLFCSDLHSSEMDKTHKCYMQNRWLWMSLIISALMPGVIGSSMESNWVVHFPVNPIHAPRGSSVTLPCTYDFPNESGSRTVQSEMWCRNQDLCLTATYVYHSANIFPDPAFRGRVQYLGSLGSRNCSLRISKLRVKDSGVYVFRFITNHPVRKLPRQKGLTLKVTDAPGNTSVTVTSSGLIAEGTSVSLFCSSFNTSAHTNFTWFQRNETTTLRGTGQKLTIGHLSSRDSGLYTCVAQNIWGSDYANITLTIHKEKGNGSSSTVIIVFGLIILLTVIIAVIICIKRHMASKTFHRARNDNDNL